MSIWLVSAIMFILYLQVWIDTHCHLDSPRFNQDRETLRNQARYLGVELCVIPSTSRQNFSMVREVAQQTNDVYALGIHPHEVKNSTVGDLQVLEQNLSEWRVDSRLVAIGEIGLDYFEDTGAARRRLGSQWYFYIEQLRIAKNYDLPVIVHMRRSSNDIFEALADKALRPERGGVIHAFNGSFEPGLSTYQVGF